MHNKRFWAGIVLFVGLALANEAIIRMADASWAYVSGGGALTVSAGLNALGLVIAAIGLYFLLKRPDKMHEVQIGRLVTTIQKVLPHIKDELESTPFANSTFGEIASVYYGLEKLGITTPDQLEVDRRTIYRQAYDFLDVLTPILRDGHLAQAREASRDIIEAVGGKPWKPKRWFEKLLDAARGKGPTQA